MERRGWGAVNAVRGEVVSVDFSEVHGGEPESLAGDGKYGGQTGHTEEVEI